MANIDRAAAGLREMDDLAAMRSPIHCLHPLAKLLTTIVYVFVTVSFDKYDLSGLAVMLLYPAVLFAFSGISVRTCLHKMRFVLLLVCAVGVWNPFFDRVPVLYVGGIAVSGGVLSMLTLMLKGALCVAASFLLVATTPMDAICSALRKIHVPSMIVTLLLLTYRYIAVMVEEVSVMTTAYQLRAPGQRGIHYSAWGSFLGQLLLRSMDRAEELFASMQLRGFNGEFWYAEGRRAQARDYIFCIAVIALLVVCKHFDIAGMLGSGLSHWG